MRPFGDLAPFSEARRILAQLGSPIDEAKRVSLVEAEGRMLAAAVHSSVDVPNADRAAMDGFAARAEDTGEKKRLRLMGRVAAGQDAQQALDVGGCIEIATGAPLPPGTDCVVPVEHTVTDGEDIIIEAPFVSGQHVSHRGDDLHAQGLLAAAGARLHPSLVAACAAGGVTAVDVWRRPRVLIVPTGDEVVPLGAGPLRPGQVFDSNAAALETLFGSVGCAVSRTPIIRDERDRLEAALTQTDADVIVTIGGTSVGRRDLVSDVVADIGEVQLHGVAVRPGKPLLLATIGSRSLVGLPGFPTSCLMMAYVTALPLLQRLGSLTNTRASSMATLGVDVASPPGKTHFLPVRLDGTTAMPTFTFSSAVSSMAHADGWIELAADAEVVVQGTAVSVSHY